MDTIDVSSKYQVVAITTPKNTGSLTTNVVIGNRIIKSLVIRYAPGHVALTGVRLMYQGVAILPWNQPTAFVFGDDETQKYDLDLYAPGGVQVVTHNADGQAAHLHILTFELQEVTNPNMNTLPTMIPQLIV